MGRREAGELDPAQVPLAELVAALSLGIDLGERSRNMRRLTHLSGRRREGVRG